VVNSCVRRCAMLTIPHLVCSEITIKTSNDTEKRKGFSRSLFVLCPLDEFLRRNLETGNKSYHFFPFHDM
jgi:hypothetical protein